MSWKQVPDETPFPIENLPYGVFSVSGGRRRLGTALGSSVIDLGALARAGLFDGLGAAGRDSLDAPNLDSLLAAGPTVWRPVRERLRELMAPDNDEVTGVSGLVAESVFGIDHVELHLPFTVGDYVDFYSSLEHATNLGRMMRPDSEPLLPNWRHIPIGYHGRSSTVVADGTPVRRPTGQTKSPEATEPGFGPTQMLDFELEVGFVTGPGNELGQPIAADDAGEHIFGLVLVNDWSARDIQAWEYQPLGPFLAKSFATSISPWVVPLAALEPYRVMGPVQEPAPLDYLRVDTPWNFDIDLEVSLVTPAMRDSDDHPSVISRTSFAAMYWNMAQQLAHLTSNGATVRPGDLMASGTVSGPASGSEGSLIELTRRGQEPITLDNGERRGFLEDGDEVVMTGWCGGEGRARISFGSVAGRIEPAGT